MPLTQAEDACALAMADALHGIEELLATPKSNGPAYGHDLTVCEDPSGEASSLQSSAGSDFTLVPPVRCFTGLLAH